MKILFYSIAEVKKDNNINYLHIFFCDWGVRWHQIVDLEKVQIIAYNLRKFFGLGKGKKINVINKWMVWKEKWKFELLEKNELKEKGFAYLGKGEEKRGFALFSYVSVLDERCEKWD